MVVAVSKFYHEQIPFVSLFYNCGPELSLTLFKCTISLSVAIILSCSLSYGKL